jgi:hypothetical protein
LQEEHKSYENDIQQLDRLRQLAASVVEANDISKQALLRCVLLISLLGC